MHEMSLIADLLQKIEHEVRRAGAQRACRVQVALGALAHISAEHFREHFEQGTRGSVAEGATLDIETSADLTDPHAQEIRLVGLEVED